MADNRRPTLSLAYAASLLYTGVVFGSIGLGPLQGRIEEFLRPGSSSVQDLPSSVWLAQLLITILVWCDLIMTRGFGPARSWHISICAAILFPLAYGAAPKSAAADCWICRIGAHLALLVLGAIFSLGPTFDNYDNPNNPRGRDLRNAKFFSGLSFLLLIIAAACPKNAPVLLSASALIGIVCYLELFAEFQQDARRTAVRAANDPPAATADTPPGDLPRKASRDAPG
jgi:hypothetical protein